MAEPPPKKTPIPTSTPKKYLSKINVETVKKIAQKLAVTKGGKKITPTAFKKFLREDKDLKHLTYKDPKSRIEKYKAEKLFQKVVAKLGVSERYRASPIEAKRLGFRLGAGGAVSSTGLKKLYKYASAAQIKAEGEAAAGPSPPELERQQRREKALQAMHKRERADEIRKEQLAKPPQPGVRVPMGGRAAPMMQGIGFSSSMNAPPAPRPGGAPITQVRLFSRREPVRMTFLPVSNLSGTPQMKTIADRVMQMFERLPKRYPNLIPSDEEKVAVVLKEIGWSDGQPWDRPTLERLAREGETKLLLFGEVQRVSNLFEVKIAAYLPSRNVVVKVCEAKETLDRLGELEQRVDWSITETFQEKFFGKSGQPGSDDTDIPSAAEARELPI